MLVKPILVDEKRIAIFPVQVLVNKSEDSISLQIKCSEGANLEDSVDEEAEFERLCLHVAASCLGAWVVGRSPSVDHVVVSAAGVFAHEANDADWEVDQVNQEHVTCRYHDGFIQKDLTEDHHDAAKTRGNLEEQELHEVILVSSAFNHCHNNVLKTVCQ